MPRAILRGVPDSFVDALSMGARAPIDVARAREQHDGYRQKLVEAGYETSVLDTDETCPDAPFIEDAAVVLDNFAVITRPGALERQPETPPVSQALAELMPTVEIRAPGTLDGGDVLRMGRTLFVGKSARTNDSGLAQFAEYASTDGMRVIATPLRGVLHLKTAVLALDDETVLIASQFTDPHVFVGYRLVEKPPDEVTSSALRLQNGRVLVTADSPLTMNVVDAAGFEVDWIDVTEFQKADGGLTCLSLLFR